MKSGLYLQSHFRVADHSKHSKYRLSSPSPSSSPPRVAEKCNSVCICQDSESSKPHKEAPQERIHSMLGHDSHTLPEMGGEIFGLRAVSLSYSVLPS